MMFSIFHTLFKHTIDTQSTTDSEDIDSKSISDDEHQLVLNNLSCWRNGTHTMTTPATLQNISLQVTQGELLVVMGASGSGKTSLLRVIAGLEAGCQGTVYLRGTCIQNDQTMIVPTEKRGIGFVFQDYALFPHLTVYQNIQFGLKHLSQDQQKERINELITLVELDPLTQRYPHQLSGGQQQRVALARAIAPKPAILLLDEPFSHLDTDLRTQVRQELLAKLRQEKMTMIWVTHEHKEALSIGDRIALLDQGKLISCDQPRSLYFNPPSQQVANWLGDWSWWHVDLTDTDVCTPFGKYNRELFNKFCPQSADFKSGKYQMGLRTQGWHLASVNTIKDDALIQVDHAMVTQTEFEGSITTLTVEYQINKESYEASSHQHQNVQKDDQVLTFKVVYTPQYGDDLLITKNTLVQSFYYHHKVLLFP